MRAPLRVAEELRLRRGVLTGYALRGSFGRALTSSFHACDLPQQTLAHTPSEPAASKRSTLPSPSTSPQGPLPSLAAGPVHTAQRSRLFPRLLVAAAALLLLLLLLRPSAPPSPSAQLPRCTGVPGADISRLVPASPPWPDWAAALGETLSAPRRASFLSHEKAHVGAQAARCRCRRRRRRSRRFSLALPRASRTVLLVSPHARAPSVAAVDAAVDAAFPACAREGCRLSLRGSSFSLSDDADRYAVSQRRGGLQSALVRHLRACPAGLVLLHGLQEVSASVLPALLPLLSEAGQYTADGQAVPAWGATVLLTAHLPGAAAAGHPEEGEEEEGLSRSAKRALQAHVAAQAGGDEAAHDLGRALRRRVDDVAPLRAQ